jgi:hypothetical protein
MTTESRDRAAAAAGAGRQRSGRALIAVQLAVSVPLLVWALLFLRTLHNFSAVNLGFDPRGLVLFEINPVRMAPTFGTAPASRSDARRVRDLLARLQAIPGVTSATVLENALVSGRSSNTEGTFGGQRARLMMQGVGGNISEKAAFPPVRPLFEILGSDPTSRAAVEFARSKASQAHRHGPWTFGPSAERGRHAFAGRVRGLNTV